MKRHDAKAEEAEEPDPEIDRWAHEVIGAALEVHRTLGPGFLESIYEHALCLELQARGVPFRRQVPLTVRYKGQIVGRGQLDLLVGRQLVVELKSVETLAPIHSVQLRSYLKALGQPLGLLINFNVHLLQDGLRRIVVGMTPTRHQ
jgi:GxxExxY protein